VSEHRLVINADDFGITAGVDAGIIEAASAGVVTSISVVTNLQHRDNLARAIERIRHSAPAAGIGLHFNCVMGSPLTECRTLMDQRGRFASVPSLVRKALLRQIDQEEASVECAAQLGVLQDIAGRATHIDGHLHLHVLPVLWSAVNRVAAQSAVPHVRLPLEPFRMNPFDVGATARKLLVYLAWRSAGGTRPDRSQSVQFAGMSLRGNSHFSARLLRLFRDLPAGTTELMVHPGHRDPEVGRFTGYGDGRAHELLTLTSSAVRERLGREDITLATFAA
jgi:predicted glycoside hydrolase/deacetylase ChbG (UPF0249 family)